MSDKSTEERAHEFVSQIDTKLVRKSLKSLISHEISSTLSKHPELSQDEVSVHKNIQLIINTDLPINRTNKKTFIQRIVPVPNALGDYREKAMLLIISNDNAAAFQKSLSSNKITENLFKKVYSVSKLRSHLSKNPKNLTRLYNEYEYVFAEEKIAQLLPKVLGETFYRNHKKLPYLVQLSTEKEFSEINHQYLKAQVKSIVKNTSFIPSKDTNIAVKIGFTDDKIKPLTENVLAVLDFLTNPQFKPSGGVIRKQNRINKLYVKTADSASLPVYEAH